jgi:hypothetical protein
MLRARGSVVTIRALDAWGDAFLQTTIRQNQKQIASLSEKGLRDSTKKRVSPPTADLTPQII